MRRLSSRPAGAAWLLIAILGAGCVGVESATPTTTDAATATASAAATPTPSPSLSPDPLPPTPTVAPTGTPTPVSGDVVMSRFADYLEQDEDFHLVMAVSGDFYVGAQPAQQASITMDGDVSGQDFAGFFSLQTAGLTIEADMVVIGDVIYIRPARGNWMPGEDLAQTQPLNPVVDADYVYEGAATIDGRTLHTVHTDEWVGGDVRQAGRLAGLRRPALESSSFDVFVDDNGLPVTSLLEFVITGRLGGQPARFEYSVIYDFSDIGEPVVIVAPI